LTEGEALEEVMYPRQPMQRFIEPSEIADAAIFLASDQAKAITGEDISVSGGM
jgi:NAD(P)-dependent dehydrogenase (short-subunit alcohol dehydrogenase family)